MKKLFITTTLLLLAATTIVNAQWSLTGNAGTNAATNFIGTTDNVAFKIRTKNAVRITVTGLGKVGIGIPSPVFKLDVKGGSINTDSVYRIGGNTVLSVKGSGNTLVGFESGYSNTTGSGNTSIGNQSLSANMTGGNNTAIGQFALVSNTSGNMNMGIGNGALYSNQTQSGNMAIGAAALEQLTNGINNNAIGAFSLKTLTTGSQNVVVGNNSGFNITSGNSNVFIGYQLADNVTTSYQNTLIGSGAGMADGIYQSTAIGDQAYVLQSKSLVLGDTNQIKVGIGTGMPQYKLDVKLGSINTDSVYRISGSTVLSIKGIGNTFTGKFSGSSNATGAYNTATGNNALVNCSGGHHNTAIGNYALSVNTTGYSNTAIGDQANTSTNAQWYATAMGAGAVVNSNDKVRIGDAGVTVVEGPVAYSWPSDARFKENIEEDVKGLDFIMKLQPVSYNFNRLKYAHHVRQHLTAEREKTLVEQSQNRTVGFIAQDVEKIIQQTGFTSFDAVHAPTNETDNYSMGYAEFVVPLVRAVQELNDENTKLKNQIEAMSSCLETLCVADESKLTSTAVGASSELNRLEQNQPNPFNTKTEINYFIANKNAKATLVVRDLNGNTLKEFTLAQSGKGSVTVDANELAAGTYTYSLFVNDKCVDTKLMVITK